MDEELYDPDCSSCERAQKDYSDLELVTDDLVALVRRLAHSLRKAAPDNDLPSKALDYLTRNGLKVSPLRDGDAVHNAKNMTNERLLALFDHYGIDSRDALIEHLHEQLTHMRIVHPIKDPQIEADRQARERYEHMVRTTTPEERERDFRENGFC